MTLRPLLLWLSAILVTVHSQSVANTWTQTTAPITNWSAVACSADGTKIVAVAGGSLHNIGTGPIYTSTNSGATWTPAPAPITYWYAVACSADGTRILAAAGPVPGPIYASTDSGATWTQTTAPITGWTSVASSADGNRLVAADPSVIQISTDAGATWMPVFTNSEVSGALGTTLSLGSSADGRVLVAGSASYDHRFFDKLYSSTNSGATWATAALGYIGPLTVASSVDGSKLVAALGSRIYRSTDFGTTWRENDVPVWAAGDGLSSLASLADGTKLVAGSFGKGIFASADSGATWAQDLAAITGQVSVACSADGGKLVAVVNNGGIWVSQIVPTPSLSIAASSSNVLVSWIVPSMNFMLQENPGLSTTGWTDLSGTPTLNLTNLHYEMTLSSTNASRFYRLSY